MPASAVPVTAVVYKLGANATGSNAIDSLGSGGSSDVWLGWANNNGGFNVGNATAMSLTDSTTDYKSAFVDTSWSSVITVDVGMYVAGKEVASMQFSPGTDKLTFYAASNLLSTSYTDLTSSSFNGNIFSGPGETSVPRRWYANQNYGGCSNDTGWFEVAGANSNDPCSWATSRRNAAGRELLYALGNTRQNWNLDTVGSADVFAVTVTFDDGTAAVPEPATMAIFGTALAGLVVMRRRRGSPVDGRAETIRH